MKNIANADRPKSVAAMLPPRPLRRSGKVAQTACNSDRREGKSCIPTLNQTFADSRILKISKFRTFRIAEAHCLSDLSQASRRGLAQARILRHSRPHGVGTRDHDATRRAGNPVVESAVAARDPQPEPERSPDRDSQHRLPDFGGAFGSGHVRPMVSGKLLPIYAAKLQFG